jgi:hypothetical protein
MTTLPPCAWRTGPWPPLPPSVAARNVVAAALHQTGRTAETIAQFRSAIAAQLGDPVPLCDLAGALREANRPEDSLAEVQQLFPLAARTDPSHARVFQRAALLRQQPLILPKIADQGPPWIIEQSHAEDDVQEHA